jgi:hypothetical protein
MGDPLRITETAHPGVTSVAMVEKIESMRI